MPPGSTYLYPMHYFFIAEEAVSRMAEQNSKGGRKRESKLSFKAVCRPGIACYSPVFFPPFRLRNQ